MVQVLNILVPLLESSSGTAQTLIYFSNSTYTRIKWLKIILDVNTYMVGVLELVSGICLIFAVSIINKYVNSLGNSINRKARSPSAAQA